MNNRKLIERKLLSEASMYSIEGLSMSNYCLGGLQCCLSSKTLGLELNLMHGMDLVPLFSFKLQLSFDSLKKYNYNHLNIYYYWAERHFARQTNRENTGCF